MDSLFRLARELASNQLWSAGIELSRNGDFEERPSADPHERVYRVLQGPRDKVVTVTLSERDEVWQCDCGSDDDPCRHVIATILAVRQGKDGRPLVRASTPAPARLIHSFSRVGAFLSFSRRVVSGESSEQIPSSLAAWIAAASNRSRALSISEDEARIDHVLTTRREGVLDPKTMRSLVLALSRVPFVELDGVPIQASPEPRGVTVEVLDDGDGFRVRRMRDLEESETFDNGVAIVAGQLRAVEDSGLSQDEIALIRGEGSYYSVSRTMELATRIVPTLAGKVSVRVTSSKLPRARRVKPRVVIETIGDRAGDSLTVVPHLVYGEPVIGEVRNGELVCVSAREVPIRDVVEESRLARELSLRLQLSLNQAKAFSGSSAIRMVDQLRAWRTTGNGMALFTPASDLTPAIDPSGSGLGIIFRSPDGKTVDGGALLAAWRSGSSFVKLDRGGWGALPSAWLAQHADALRRLLEAREHSDMVAPAVVLADVDEVCGSLGLPAPDYFSKLREALRDRSRLPTATLPEDLTAELRDYQLEGVNWLAFLRDHGLNALLADDMGLGKTLQAMCVITDRALVVCPTSVLGSWAEQLRRFRPGLRVSVYHGPRRELDPHADVTLTSYAIMRLDADELHKISWGSVILDEAQIIRNRESQVARAVFKLSATHRVSLSGTPVENSLDDLWSQCHFLNPGLLGTYTQFQERYAEPILSGDNSASVALRARVSPFILRRMKRDVAKELPPKTEVVIRCELQGEERVLYEALLASARGEVLGRLDEGVDIISALEALLRLRQACCHPALVPGHSALSSSKVELLVESLKRSIGAGHRALVFSQWTSLLDLIEPHLVGAVLSFARIDGDTRDRARVVESFQSPDGPNLLLLSLKAGGLGLTLTAADHVFIVDPWWNPAAEDQAADRAYRIGQSNPVLVHRLVAQDTVEERILALQERKRGLLSAAVGESGRGPLTRDELLELLQ